MWWLRIFAINSEHLHIMCFEYCVRNDTTRTNLKKTYKLTHRYNRVSMGHTSKISINFYISISYILALLVKNALGLFRTWRPIHNITHKLRDSIIHQPTAGVPLIDVDYPVITKKAEVNPEVEINKSNPIANLPFWGPNALLLKNMDWTNYSVPNPVQKHRFQIIHNEWDMACTQTGPGETAALLHPILHKSIII
jgi:hypothetical protein